MPAYLVSFTSPGGQFDLTYGSHVVDLPTAPSSTQDILDLQASLAMEYGSSNAILLALSLLPDEATHPGSSGLYGYFISFHMLMESGTGLGTMTAIREEPMCTLEDLRDTEESTRAGCQVREVHFIGCIPLREPSPEALQGFMEKIAARNIE